MVVGDAGLFDNDGEVVADEGIAGILSEPRHACNTDHAATSGAGVE